MEPQQVNLKLKARIIERFGSQVDFARALKVDEQTISRVIRGREGLPEEAQKQWAKKLSCDIKEEWPLAKAWMSSVSFDCSCATTSTGCGAGAGCMASTG